uniref:Uncharacterized protein n=1 Tax=Anguilla anguilla TaxID=7936 RepID=A0A0E9QSA1_ANGAN
MSSVSIAEFTHLLPVFEIVKCLRCSLA